MPSYVVLRIQRNDYTDPVTQEQGYSVKTFPVLTKPDRFSPLERMQVRADSEVEAWAIVKLAYPFLSLHLCIQEAREYDATIARLERLAASRKANTERVH